MQPKGRGNGPPPRPPRSFPNKKVENKEVTLEAEEMFAEEEEVQDLATDSIDVGANEAEAASIKRARDGRPLNGDEFMNRIRSTSSINRS